MKIILLIFLCFFQSTFAAEPKWVTDPSVSCPAGFICAVGEGSGSLLAQANARKEIAKYFETKISSKLIFSKEAKSIERNDSIQGVVQNDVEKILHEYTDQTLEGVEIAKTYRGQDSFYALAKLSKRKTQERLKGQMLEIDELNSLLFKQQSRSDLNKILKNLSVRDKIEQKYQVITGGTFKGSISKAGVLKQKNANRAKRVKVKLFFEGKKHGKELSALIKRNVLDQDFFLVSRYSKIYNFLIRANVQIVPQFLNVKGFNKYKFLLTINSFDQRNNKAGAIVFESVEVGRSQGQAFSKFYAKTTDYLYENLSLLNLDKGNL